MTDSTPKPGTNVLKYVSLVTLTFQVATLTLSLRYGRTRVDKDDLFVISTGWLVGIHYRSVFNVRIIHSNNKMQHIFNKLWEKEKFSRINSLESHFSYCYVRMP